MNLVIDGDRDGVARSEERLVERGVVSAWVTAADARTGEPDEHDERLARACAGSATHHVVPVLVPPTGAPGAFERARRLTESALCRVFRLCPRSHGYPLADWVLSPLPELCERQRAALVLDFAPERVEWPDTVAFARRSPGVPMVVLEADVSTDRAAPAALDTAPNLLLHVGRADAVERLVGLVAIFGGHRFVWGSSESADADAVRQVIADAEGMAQEDRTAILSGNAEALQDGTYAEAFL